MKHVSRSQNFQFLCSEPMSLQFGKNMVPGSTTGEIITVEKIAFCIKLSSEGKGFQSMNGQYRTVKLEFNRAKLPPHVKFILSSDDDSYAVDSRIFIHGVPFEKEVKLNHQSAIVLQPTKMKYHQKITGCENVNFWKKLTPLFEARLKKDKCPIECFPIGYLMRLTHC